MTLKEFVLGYGQNSIGRLPYHIGAYGVRFLLESKYPVRAWCRHSYAFGDIVPGASDLDFTLLFDSAPSPEVVQSLLHDWDQMRRGLPFLGEFNLCSRESVRLFLEFGNPCEISRDPLLLREFQVSSRPASEGEITVFLLRSLLSDADNLSDRLVFREKRWKRLCQIAGVAFPKVWDLESLMTLIWDRLPKGPDSFAVQQEVLDHLIRGGRLHSTDAKILFANYYFEELLQEPFESHPWVGLIPASLGWEFWGLYTQAAVSALRPPPRGFWWHHHLARCAQMGDRLGLSTEAPIRSLKDLYDRYATEEQKRQ